MDNKNEEMNPCGEAVTDACQDSSTRESITGLRAIQRIIN